MQEVPVPTDTPALTPRDGEQVAFVLVKHGYVYGERAVVAGARLLVADVQASQRGLRADLGVVIRAPAGAGDSHVTPISAAQKFQLVKEAGLELRKSAAALASKFHR